MAQPPGSEPPPTERRPKRRSRTSLPGIISNADGKNSFNCSIRDISDTGARVLVRGQHIPSDFYLIHVRDRVVYDAKVVWSSGKEVGVSIKNTFRLADKRDPAHTFLTRLWYNYLALAKHL